MRSPLFRGVALSARNKPLTLALLAALTCPAVAQVAAGPLQRCTTQGGGGVWVTESSSSFAPYASVSGASRGMAFGVRVDGTVSGWGVGAIDVGLSSLKGIKAMTGMGSVVAALKSDGTVMTWGLTFGLYDPPPGLNNVKAITAGDDFVVALRNDGTLVAWGSNNQGQINVPPGLNDVTQVSSAGAHTIALRADGTVVAWGRGSFNENDVPPGLHAQYVSAGSLNGVAITTDGAVVEWGLNNAGQANVPWEFDPANVSHSRAKAISCGDVHTLVLRENGTVAVWGATFYGPIAVPPGLIARSVSAGRTGASLAIDLNGKLVSWGGMMLPNFSESLLVDGGYTYLAGLGPQGRLQLAGYLDPVFGQVNPLESLQGMTQVKSIGAGPDFIVLLKTDGSLTALGSNNYGQTNVGSLPNDFTRLSAGAEHMLALRANGTVYAWGSNYSGQSNVPFGLANVAQVSAGSGFSVALLKNGTVTAWGGNSLHETEVPPNTKAIVQIAAGSRHTLALDKFGKVKAWGDNYYGQCNVPPGLSDVVQVAAAGPMSLARLSDGSVVSWGQLGIFTGITDTFGFIGANPGYSFSQPCGLKRLSLEIPKWSTSAAEGVSVDVILDKVATVPETVFLDSDDNSVVDPPVSVLVPAGQKKVSVHLTAAASSEPKTVTLSATCGGTVAHATASVLPPSPKMALPQMFCGYSLSKLGKILLNGPAPDGGATFQLISSNPSLIVPSTVTVPEGATDVNFQLKTEGDITVPSTCQVIATSGAISVSKFVFLEVNAISAVAAPVTTFVGGSAEKIKVTVYIKDASTKAFKIGLSSSDPAVYVPPSKEVSPFSKSVSFFLTHHPVSEVKVVTISMTHLSQTVTLNVTVNP